MKTFIWNTEETVYVAVAEDLEKARWCLRSQFVKQSKEQLINEKDKHESFQPTVPSYVLSRAKSILECELRDLLEIWAEDPEYILENKSCVIYKHVNQ
jgi:hypothetical protein